jgi:hypothetical protein
MTHLVSALRPGTSLLTLSSALLDHVLVLHHAASLLHELTHGGVALAILVILVGVVVSVVGGVAAVGVVAGGAANAGAGGGATDASAGGSA